MQIEGTVALVTGANRGIGNDDRSRTVKAGLSNDQQVLYPAVEQEYLALAGSGS